MSASFARRIALITTLALGLGACASSGSKDTESARIPAPQPITTARPTTPTPPPLRPVNPSAGNAFYAGVRLGPEVGALGIGADDARTALGSFIESCPKLTARTDKSGLTQNFSWQRVCDEARSIPFNRAQDFFATEFETLRIGDGNAFATGYFEPEIDGSRTPYPGYNTPVYRTPPDLVRGWPDGTPPSERTSRGQRGRYDESGAFVPYYDRAQIEDGALAGRGLEIAWVRDPIEFFFLQIQGSGRLRAPDGSIMRIGYADQNGRGYTAIGKLMRERGLLGDGPGQYPGSMQGIVQYLRENPAEGRALMRENQSWIFFRELTGDGPLGALGVPVRRLSSVAADPNFVPLGAPVWLNMERPEASGLWVAQDTGGAIKGANRFDTFWGAGPKAAETAGGMSARGEALILVPRGTYRQLQAR